MEQGNSTSSHKGWYGRGYHPHCDCPGLFQSIGFRLFDSVPATLLHFDSERYDLLAWCVMPNHVHALIATRVGYPLAEILHSWKSFTAHRANKILDRIGDFWLVDYFDQFMRTTDQMETTIMYIEFNPVKAGLVVSPSLWRFSSSSPKHQERVINNRIKYPTIDPSSLPDFRC